MIPVPAGKASWELVVYDHASRRATVVRRAIPVNDARYEPSQ